MRQPTEVWFLQNGNTAAFDTAQIPELQTSWLLLYVEFLVSKGADPTKISLGIRYLTTRIVR